MNERGETENEENDRAKEDDVLTVKLKVSQLP